MELRLLIPIRHSISGIKCDADGCDYRDDSIHYSDYREYIGKPCPQCGDNLLTMKDYIACVRIKQAVFLLNIVLFIPHLIFLAVSVHYRDLQYGKLRVEKKNGHYTISDVTT